jgi:hypothetical protein
VAGEAAGASGQEDPLSGLARRLAVIATALLLVHACGSGCNDKKSSNTDAAAGSGGTGGAGGAGGSGGTGGAGGAGGSGGGSGGTMATGGGGGAAGGSGGGGGSGGSTGGAGGSGGGTDLKPETAVGGLCTKHTDCPAGQLCVTQNQCSGGSCRQLPAGCNSPSERSCACANVCGTGLTCIDQPAGCVLCTAPP